MERDSGDNEEYVGKSNIKYINHYMPSDKKVRNYSLLYDSELKLAYWVAYPYCSYYDGSAGRNEKWAYDPEISSSLQVNLKNSYGISGYDRGHQIPVEIVKGCGEQSNDVLLHQHDTTNRPGVESVYMGKPEGKVRS